MIHETRQCQCCGEEKYDGMTTDDGDIWVCEDCFEKYMDETYGKHQWMSVPDDGCGGYYMVSDVYGAEGTGIYYTTWEWADYSAYEEEEE